MNITITNSSIIIKDIDVLTTKNLQKSLTFTDKAKQYQLRRMSKNSWSRNTDLYKKLQQEVESCLLKEHEDTYVIPSGFLGLPILKDIKINDQRSDTGDTIALPWIKKPPVLRDYQEEAVILAKNSHRGLINFATGLGKTLVAVYIVKHFHKKTLIVCPSESIAKQFYEIMCTAFGQINVGMFGAGKKKINNITVGIAASVNNSIELFKKANLGLVIVDEVHHIPANTFFSIAENLSEVGRLYGLTATDFRSDGKDIMITAGCGDVLIRRDITWGVANGWLAKPYFLVRKVNTVGKSFKESKLKNYKEHVLNNKLMKDTIKCDVEKLMQQGLSVLCLVNEVAHGEELASQLGIPFATGLDSKSQDYVDQLNSGKIKGLIGTDGKISEGTDTRNVDALVLANFVASKGPVLQAIGRGLRKQGTKTKCLIVDYIPEGSEMLTRHAWMRIGYYEELDAKITII